MNSPHPEPTLPAAATPRPAESTLPGPVAPAAAAPPPGTPWGQPGSGSVSGSGLSRPSAGRQVREGIEARLLECEGYERHKKDFGVDGEKPGRPAYPVTGYQLVEPIGEGSFGSVWKAQDSDDSGRVVAIKFFPHRAAGGGAMLEELRHLKKLDNKQGFVQLLDINPGAEWPYFVMTYSRRSLQQEIAERGPLPVREAVRVFTAVVRAMAHAHAKKPGMCHCDLKPSNILLADLADGPDPAARGPTDERSTPLVSDFGQSRLLDRADRAALGSFFYMPPDQADVGRELPDARWDVYALGAVGYQMVNPERVPPRAEGWEKAGSALHTKTLPARLAAYRDHLANAPRPTAHRRAPGMDPRLAAILDRCLDLDPARRFPDAGAVLEALRARARARRRTPVIVLGVLATLACLTAAVLAGLALREQVVAEQRDKLTKQIQAGQAETAFITARLLEDKLGRLVKFFERAVPEGAAPPGRDIPPGTPDPRPVREALERAVGLVQTNHGKPLPMLWLAEDRKPVDDWLLALGRQTASEQVFTSRGLSVVVNANGYGYHFSALERSADGLGWELKSPWQNRANLDRSTRNFAWRDWFSAGGYDRNEREHAAVPWKPVRDTHISVVFRAKLDGRWILVVSRPIYGTVPGGARDVVGLLVGGSDLRKELTGWIEERNEQATPDQQGRQSTLTVVDDRGHVIWRPDLVTHEIEGIREGSIARGVDDPDEARVYDKLKRHANWEARLSRTADGTEWLTDPWDDGTRREGTNYLAKAAPFYPLGRGPGVRPWHVIVQQEEAKALKPVDDLQSQTMVWGMKVLGAFLAVAALLWGGVFWVLRGTEGVADV